MLCKYNLNIALCAAAFIYTQIYVHAPWFSDLFEIRRSNHGFIVSADIQSFVFSF